MSFFQQYNKLSKIVLAAAAVLLIIGGLSLGFNSFPKLGGIYNQSSGTPIYISSVAEETVIPAGSNTILNGDFATGDLSYWTTTTFAGLNAGVEEGAAYLEMAVTSLETPGGVMGQISSSTYNAGTHLNFTMDYKASETSSENTTLLMIFTNNLLGSSDYVFNFNTGNWEATTTIEQQHLYDFRIGDNLSTSTTSTINWDNLTGEYPLTAPPSGTITVSLVIVGNENDKVYLDNISLYSVTSTIVTPVQSNLFVYRGSTTTYTQDSTFCLNRLSVSGDCGLGFTGVSNNWLKIFTFDNTGIDFRSSTGVRVPTSSDVLSAVNKVNSQVLLGATDLINLKNTGVTSLNFTLPSGYKIINPSVLIEIISADSLTGNYQLSIGNNAGSYDNILPTITPNIVNANQQRLFSSGGSPINVCSTAGEVYVNLTNADTGTAGTAKVYLFGTLIQN